jgi:hypothetical protein
MLMALTVLAALADMTGTTPPREAPSDAAVLRALPRLTTGIPYVYEEFRDDLVIVKNYLERKTIPVPLFAGGTVNVLKEQWECVADYQRVIESQFPFPLKLSKKEVSVVYIDKFTPVK